MTNLGQNFLTSEITAHKIVDTAQIKPGDVVLEVGPGKGILTEILLKKVGSESSPKSGRVVAVEKDPKLVEYLHKKFATHKNLEIIEGDILKFDVSSFKIQNSKYKIVANIPYYITSHFLKTYLETETQPASMTLTIQKEVAQRIVAEPPQMSILSLSVQAYGKPKIIDFISKNEFSPVPKVDSAIIKISNISRKFFNERGSTSLIKEREFFDLIRKGFSSKRKMLKNNLKVSPEVLTKSGLLEKIRAQELSLENWRCLYFFLKTNR